MQGPWTKPTTVFDRARFYWRRAARVLNRYAAAMEFDVTEHHERRLARLEADVAALRASDRRAAGPGWTVAPPPANTQGDAT